MRKTNMIIAMLAVAGILAAVAPAPAQLLPIQAQTAITSGATTVDWAVPAGAYGPLLSLHARGLTNAATLKVEHLVPYTGGIFTNTVEAAAAGDTLLVYPPAYVPVQYYVTNNVILASSPPKPVLLARGDSLRFTVTAANSVSAPIVIRLGIPGR